MNKSIAIAGLGWLGQPLAYRLSTIGYHVKGSVTSCEKAVVLQNNGFDAFPMEISEMGVTGEISAFLNNVHSLIIMIPPGLRNNTGADYVLKMSNFLVQILESKVENVILVSSTSVYGDLQGKVSEEDKPHPETEAGRQLLEVEKLFFECEGIRTTIVRFGGLLGGSRQPVKYLAGRKNLNDGNAPVNLVHRNDCISILEEILKQGAFGHIFNAVNPQHPKKSDYYIAKAKELGLEPPTFSEVSSEEIFKQVDSVNLKAILNYTFRENLY